MKKICLTLALGLLLGIGMSDAQEINELKSAERTKDVVSSFNMGFYIEAVPLFYYTNIGGISYKIEGDEVQYVGLGLMNVSPRNYKAFTNNSRILFRLSTGNTYICGIKEDAIVDKSYRRSWNSSSETWDEYYTVYTEFTLPQECLNELNGGATIVKVRVVFDNGDMIEREFKSGKAQRATRNLLKAIDRSQFRNERKESAVSDDSF